MNPTVRILLPAAALALTVAAPATPFNPAEVSADANWYAHADLDRARQTEVGRAIMTEVEEKHGAQLRAVKRMFSLNPLSDLKGITLWGTGEENKGVVLIRGAFDRGHLTDLLAANEEYATSQHEAHTVHSWKDKEKTQHGAFFRDDLVVISEHRGFVTKALEVLDGREPAMEGYPETGASFLMGVANLEGIEIEGDEAQLFKRAKALRVRAYEADGRMQAEATLTAVGEKEAARFRKVLDGMVALALLAHEELADLGLDAKVSVANGTEVTINLSGPIALVLDVLDKASKESD